MRKLRLLLRASLVLLVAAHLLWPARKQKQEDEIKTQVRELLPEPPPVVTAEASRLVFGMAPPARQGLLSRQVRDSLRALFKLQRRSRIVHLRAFVAGSGDTRRVRAVVSEVFADKKQPLPSLTVVQVGKLPIQGTQVILQWVAESRKVTNPEGLAFLSGQPVASEEVTLEVAPLVRESIARLGTVLSAAGLAAQDVLRATCYCSSLQDSAEVRRAMMEAFPDAVLVHMQLRRAYTTPFVSCEAVARLRESPGERPRCVKPPGAGESPEQPAAVLVGPVRLAFSGAQLGFQYQDSDVRLAFERLGRSLEAGGTSFAGIVAARFYPLFGAMAEKIRQHRFEFFDRERPPAMTMVEPEGLPSLDASFAMEVVAVARR